MKRLKIVQSGWETYTSWLNGVEFVNGLSTTEVPRYIADRIGGTISVVEVDAEGVEANTVNPAERMIGGQTISAPVVDEMRQPSLDEVKAEMLKAAEDAGVTPASAFYSRAALEEIADRKGLKGLREIAQPWNVRDRSIPALITEILAAQGKYIKRIEDAGGERPAIQGPDIVDLNDNGDPIETAETKE